MPVSDKSNFVDEDQRLRLRSPLPGRPFGLANEMRLLALRQQERARMPAGTAAPRAHILDKLDMLNEKGREFDQSLEADVDRLAGRYDEVHAKKDQVFDRQHSALEEREHKLNEIDARLDRLSNLGNSSGGSTPQKNGGTDARVDHPANGTASGS